MARRSVTVKLPPDSGLVVAEEGLEQRQWAAGLGSRRNDLDLFIVETAGMTTECRSQTIHSE